MQEGHRVPSLMLHISGLCAPGFWEMWARPPGHRSLLGDTGGKPCHIWPKLPPRYGPCHLHTSA